MGDKFWVRNVAQGEYLPPTDSALLSEKSVKSAAKMEMTKYGSQAWGMADVAADGFHSFAATWEQIRIISKTS